MKKRRSRPKGKWVDQVEEHRKSGQTLMEYCRKSDFSHHQARHRRNKAGISIKKKLKRRDASEGFARIKPVKNTEDSGRFLGENLIPEPVNRPIVIRYKSGTELELPSNFDLNQLITLVKLERC